MIKEVQADVVTDGAGVTGVSTHARRPPDISGISGGRRAAGGGRWVAGGGADGRETSERAGEGG